MKNRRRKNSGFTLLEILLVMAILVVLGSLSTFAILSLQRGAYTKACATEISTMKTACTAYKLQAGSYPSTLDDLYAMPSGLTQAQWGGPYLEKAVLMDPWRRPYTYSADEVNNRVSITSAGPDGQAGTQDDVPEPAGQ